ncbi:hypothetical protein MKW94_024786 [Papaver nudicaule]|uniref:Cation/H+ exchanger domain-containing protein n=1 Tax=Papaver nudicaule TaxID=74823 RepID=A0AA42B011_PAPNU|nr:hypothetical protein [Papaver nudicaule]
MTWTINFKCNIPGRVNSGGLIYADFDINSFEFSPLPRLALQIVILLFASRLLHRVLSRFHQPMFVSQILAGVIFADGFGFGIPFKRNKEGQPLGISSCIFPAVEMEALETLAHFSSMFFIFKVGVQTDPKILKTSGLRTYILGLSCYVCPLISGNNVSYWLKNEHIKYIAPSDPKAPGFFGSIRIVELFTFVSFPVIAYVLTDLNILNSDMGHLALQVAMVANFLQLAGKTFKIGKLIVTKKSFFEQNLTVGLVLVGLFIFIFFIVRPAALWIVKNTPEGKPVKETYITLIMISVLLCGVASEYCGFSMTDGAFFVGLAIPDGPPLGTSIVDKLDYMITSFLMPLQMGMVGLKTNIPNIRYQFEFVWRAGLLIISCTFAKIMGVVIPGVFLGVPIQDGFLLGLIMNLKGIVEVSILNNWKKFNKVQIGRYALNTALVAGVVVTAAVFTPVVKYLYDPSAKYSTSKRRSILQLKQNKTEFRVLACVHTQDDVPNIIRLLEASNPTKFCPLTVYILHLVELVGRASPLLIAHPRHRSISSSNTCKSERILNAFQQFEDRYHNLVTVTSFTTISPYASMHNDICSMSVDKRTALILFPFWRQDAIYLRDDVDRQNIANRAIRTLLQNLFRNSPCSIGILVEGTNYQAQSICFLPDMPYRVIVLFFGGPDDREALVFAMNMIHHPLVSVTLVRFYGQESLTSDELFAYHKESINIERHKFLDEELVDNFRIKTMHDKTLEYKELEVKDGEDTIWEIHSLKEDFDLMVVGRQQITHTKIISGLNVDWGDQYEELGVIGDMVTSPDYNAKGSILIINQRQDVIS